MNRKDNVNTPGSLEDARKSLKPTPLPSNLRRNGFLYGLLCRSKKYCLYAQYGKDIATSYEVFLIKALPQKLLPNGKELLKREGFPKDRDFGITAWSFINFLTALKKFKDIESSFINPITDLDAICFS
ncbi:hypothetical protein JYU23_01175 [bacterium AH-315-C07]|nr:hypothetical protein [bacterium AH-315-C07]